MLRLGAQGRTVIPAEFRRALGLHDGDELIAWIEDGRLIVRSRAAIASETRGLYRQMPEDMVADLIAERRAEARREEAESASHGSSP